ncbi:MAG: DUF1566 domain-containing protein [Bacteroidetes bacterium]|nr:DUF1566 domain-containing protein [Bacteroidota bacterium]
MKTIIMLSLAVSALVLSSCNKHRTPTYEVGQEAFGGIVIKLDASGEHGVVVAKTDQVTISTGNNYSESAAIVNMYSEGGSGWRIPSKEELLAIYSMKASLGTFQPWHYWSSTKNGSKNFTVHFGTGSSNCYCNGNANFCSRAVKDF